MLSTICQNGLQSYYFFLIWQNVLYILCIFLPICDGCIVNLADNVVNHLLN